MTSAGSSWRRRLCRPLVGVVLATIGACGVNVDDAPRALNIPETTTTVSPTPSTGRFSTVLYYVAEGDLMPVVRDLPDRTVATILARLLDPPSGALGDLSSSIPSGTTLLGVQRNDGLVSVDLSDSFENVVGQSRQQAIGQIVLTVTELSSIDTVRFRVEGEPVTVSSPVRGDSQEVTPCDFLPMMASLPSATDGLPGPPDAGQVELINRLDELRSTCPDAEQGGS